MDKAVQTTGAFKAKNIQAQVELILGQLIQASLLSLAQKYHLPQQQIEVLSEVSGAIEPISTNLYSVEIVHNRNQSAFNVTLEKDQIDSLIADHFEKFNLWQTVKGLFVPDTVPTVKLQEHKWSFLGFITESPMMVDELKIGTDFWKRANISTQKSMRVLLPLKKEIPYYALFVLAVENEEQLVIDGDVATMLPPPPATPSLDDISNLRFKLKLLLGELPQAEKESRHKLITAAFEKKAKDLTSYKAKLEKLNHDEAQIGDMVSELDEVLTADIRSCFDIQ